MNIQTIEKSYDALDDFRVILRSALFTVVVPFWGLTL